MYYHTNSWSLYGATFILCFIVSCVSDPLPPALPYILGVLPASLKCRALDALCTSTQLHGRVSDCLCFAEDADTENKGILPLLTNLTHLSYFRYYKVALEQPCSLAGWPEPTCAVEACSVDDKECPAAEPVCTADGSVVSDGHAASAALGNVDLSGTSGLAGWDQGADAWTEALLSEEEDAHYVDLLKNPEGYTGYGVLDPFDTGAQRLWARIHAQACLSGEGAAPACLEERVLQRLVGGLHASVSTHIALTVGDGVRATTFGAPNASAYAARVGRHRERLENLYFTYLFVARAVARAGPTLAAEVARRGSGLPSEDAEAVELLGRLARALTGAGGAPGHLGGAFDERALFSAQSDAVARTSLPPTQLPTYRGAFRAISELLNCVGCLKCRMWGKLQFLGVGSAMKVLLHDVEARAAPPGVAAPPAPLRVTRNELVALVNVFHRLALSIDAGPKMREIEAAEALKGWLPGEATAVETVRPGVGDGGSGGGGGGGGAGSGSGSSGDVPWLLAPAPAGALAALLAACALTALAGAAAWRFFTRQARRVSTD